MELEVKPLSKKIFDKARNLGVDTITLSFAGGIDEGLVNVDCSYDADKQPLLDVQIAANVGFEEEIEEWVWQVYTYDGFGDGHDYGEDLTYDIKNATKENEVWLIPTTNRDWAYEVSYGEADEAPVALEITEEAKALSTREKLDKWVLPALKSTRSALNYAISEEGVSSWHRRDMRGDLPSYFDIPSDQIDQALRAEMQELDEVVQFVTKLIKKEKPNE